MKKFCFFILMVCSLQLYSWARGDTFRGFPNYYFVETGTFEGDGTLMALQAKVFKEIRTVELSEKWYHHCIDRFKNYPNVSLYLGDSGALMWDMIKDITQPITFWLDSHYSGPRTAKGEVCCPLIQELEAIKNHPIKNHIILIDDVRLMGTHEFDYITREEVIAKIKEINPHYHISYREGYKPGDIMVARVIIPR